ncbi:hypothetical protein BX661DRAFT_180269 [Kickxella alabastrina]|uniref:uncharacterized protein n=1 Tax=Kickxella alabastrina TaxID=61397 RepID=UPI00221FE3A8|nr:uncharacterized protein BX661DRAFT_180269 [Kickxella alabastrina]KAI7830892.1 hypothetical protein BX661DRAFT_180269 [Kickxella alabastrina]
MQLNTRLDQSLDDIIRENRKQQPKPATAPAKAAAKPRIKKATGIAKRLTVTSTGGAANKPTRRVNNKVAAIKTSSLSNRANKSGITSRLGTSATSGVRGRVASGRIGAQAGRVGKAGRVTELATRGKAPALDRNKSAAAIALRQRIAKVAEAPKRGEAGPATIFISNLDTEASAEDVKTCFKQFGAIKNSTLLYDRNGKASGHAEVTFAAKTAAEEAAGKLDNVLADGRRLSVRVMPVAATARAAGAHTHTSGNAQLGGGASSGSAGAGRKSGRKFQRRGPGNRMDID